MRWMWQEPRRKISMWRGALLPAKSDHAGAGSLFSELGPVLALVECKFPYQIFLRGIFLARVPEALSSRIMVDLNHPMKQVANWALNVANMRGASYGDARIVSQRSRALTTKNGKVGSASDAESVGISVRVIADGAWGFAASEDLSRSGVEATAAHAVEIARASAQVKQQDVQLAQEKSVTAEWTTPHLV